MFPFFVHFRRSIWSWRISTENPLGPNAPGFVPEMEGTTFFISENSRMDVWRIFKNDLKVVFKNPPVWVVAFLWSILILRKFFQNPPEVQIRQKTEDAPKMRRKKQARSNVAPRVYMSHATLVLWVKVESNCRVI